MFVTYVAYNLPQELTGLIEAVAEAEGVSKDLVVTAALWSGIYSDLDTQYDELATFVIQPNEIEEEDEVAVAKSVADQVIDHLTNDASPGLSDEEVDKIVTALRG